MQANQLFLPLVLAGMLFLPACSNELKKDTDQIGDAMCRNIEVMAKLRTVNLNDTAAISKLQEDEKKIQDEMTALYQDFRKKYADKIQDKEFNKKFSNELRKSMLDNCKNLSKEDRDQFEKDLEN